MVSTSKVLTYNIPLDVVTSGTMKNPSTRKSLGQFLALLDVKQIIDAHRFRAAKTKRKKIQIVGDLWYIIHNWRGHEKLSQVLNNIYITGFYIIHKMFSIK